MTDPLYAQQLDLRDLGDDDFNARFDTDRFTATVLGNRLRYIVEHVSTRLLTNAFSMILRDWYDFNATISGPPDLNYQMPAAGNSIASFFGSISEAIRNVVEEYGVDDLREGDVLISNDPYRVGTHVNDMCFIRPVFVDGRIISFISIKAHQLDMGGVVPAGFSATKRDVFDTGLVLAPMLLYRNDKPVRSTFNLLFDNTRYGAIILPDIKTIHSSLQLGEVLIHQSVTKYGAAAYRGSIRYAVDSSAQAMAYALAEIEDGTYYGEGGVDADAVDDTIEYKIRVALTKVDDRLEIDFSGTSPQARTSINAAALDAKSAVVMALKILLDPTSPYTSGALRNVDLVLPAGTLVSATPPNGSVFMFWEATQPVIAAIFSALDQALGDRAVGGDFGSMGIHNANGVTADGTPWVSTAQCGGEHGPWGATRAGDADSYQSCYQANGLDPAIEAIEADSPVVILRREYVADSAGAGFNRGGAAVRKDTLFLTPAEHWSSQLSTKRAPGVGVNSGEDGTAPGTWLFPPEVAAVDRRQDLVPVENDSYVEAKLVAGVFDPETKQLDKNGLYHYYGETPIWKTGAGSVFRYQTAGGGGWGDPWTREPERVLVDVRSRYVTVEGADRDFGVVILGDPLADPEGLSVDVAATTERRQTVRNR